MLMLHSGIAKQCIVHLQQSPIFNPEAVTRLKSHEGHTQ